MLFQFNGERYKILKAEIGSGAGKVGEVISDYLEIIVKIISLLKFLKSKTRKEITKIGEFMLGSQIKKEQ